MNWRIQLPAGLRARGTRSAVPAAVAACQAPDRSDEVPVRGHPVLPMGPGLSPSPVSSGVSFVVTAGLSSGSGRATCPTSQRDSRAAAAARRPGQRLFLVRRALATFFYGVERTAATLRLAAVLTVVGLAVLAVAVETLTPEPSPETPDAPEGLPAKNDRPGHPKPTGDSSEMCC